MTRTATPAKNVVKVLSAIYMATDCSNEVYDYATLHHAQRRIAESVPSLVVHTDGVLSVDGDGFMATPERYGRGYRLTRQGYEALTAHDPKRWPPHLRRFA